MRPRIWMNEAEGSQSLHACRTAAKACHAIDSASNLGKTSRQFLGWLRFGDTAERPDPDGVICLHACLVFTVSVSLSSYELHIEWIGCCLVCAMQQ